MANKQMKDAQTHWQSGKHKLKPQLGAFHTCQVYMRTVLQHRKKIEIT